jgi:D-alanyl-D-alanine-carboxypeptidase/D-alanyl-D-alanine-endopeptidase
MTGKTVIELKPNGLMARLAVPHSKNGQVVSVWDFGCLEGCGALRSSVSDMLKFSQACLDASKDSDDPVLRSLAVAMAAKRDAGGGSTRVGLLWHRTKTGFGEMIWHNGGTAGSRSFLGINPATRQTVIVLTNCGVSVDKLAIGVLTDLAKNRKETKSRPDVSDAAK